MKKYVVLFCILSFTFILQAQPLKMMTYNIRYHNQKDGVNNWCNRKDKVVKLLSQQLPDVLAVQEALHCQMKDLGEALKDYNYVGVGRNGRKNGEYTALWYKKERLRKIESGSFWFSEKPQLPGSVGWDAACPRMATWATYEDVLTQKSFVVLTCHLDHVGNKARLMSMVQLKSWFATLLQQTPVILCGDFNFQPWEEPYGMFFDNELHWEDARPHDYTQGTFCGFEKDKMECITIDYVFHTPEWKVEKFEVLTDNDGTYYPSDHLPIVVTVTLQP